MITQIIPNVLIGEYTDVFNKEALEQAEIDCILSLRGGMVEDSSSDEEQHCHRLGIAFFRVPIYDMDYWFNHENASEQAKIRIQCLTASYMLELLTKQYKRILVHCTSGIDRAPFVVALHLQSNKWGINVRDMEASYMIIKSKRPQIVEHYEWI